MRSAAQPAANGGWARSPAVRPPPPRPSRGLSTRRSRRRPPRPTWHSMLVRLCRPGFFLGGTAGAGGAVPAAAWGWGAAAAAAAATAAASATTAGRAAPATPGQARPGDAPGCPPATCCCWLLPADAATCGNMPANATAAGARAAAGMGAAGMGTELLALVGPGPAVREPPGLPAAPTGPAPPAGAASGMAAPAVAAAAAGSSCCAGPGSSSPCWLWRCDCAPAWGGSICLGSQRRGKTWHCTR